MSDTPAKLTGIKGFDRDFSCRGFKFEIGETYRAEGEIKACENGFHLIPADHSPLAVFRYYEPAVSRFAVVEYGGATDRDGDKIAAEEITVLREITLDELIAEAITFCGEKAASNSGTYGAAGNTGDYGAASNSGYRGAASNTGDYGAARNSGYRGAASNSGTRGAASNSGEHGSAADSNGTGTVRGTVGSALFALERGPGGEIVSTASGIVGQDGIKPDTPYRCSNGKLVEVSE
jgi:hypothetical protein